MQPHRHGPYIYTFCCSSEPPEDRNTELLLPGSLNRECVQVTTVHTMCLPSLHSCWWLAHILMGFLLSCLSLETTINRSLAAAGSSSAQAEVPMHNFTQCQSHACYALGIPRVQNAILVFSGGLLGSLVTRSISRS